MTPIHECCVSTGDPQGIGPEVSVKAAREMSLRGSARVVLVGVESDLMNAGASASWPRIRENEDALAAVSLLPVPASPQRIEEPPPSGDGGRRALAALDVALRRVRAAPRGRALVTAPVSKVAVTRSGVPFDGHTGWIARECGTTHVVMLFEAPKFRVALATVHVPHSKVASRLSFDGLLATLRVIDADLRTRFGLVAPRIAVLGLNPHAGESGSLGSEEIDVITPAIAQAVAEGLHVRGPFPADTWFRPEFESRADCTLAMYHDQGLLPVKCLAFGTAVNVTLGLPIIRTSVDHGTAFDIAGRGIADASSMLVAMDVAQRLLNAP